MELMCFPIRFYFRDHRELWRKLSIHIPNPFKTTLNFMGLSKKPCSFIRQIPSTQGKKAQDKCGNDKRFLVTLQENEQALVTFKFP